MGCKRCKFYTQLMLLVGAMFINTPLSAHQLGHETNHFSAMWHNFTHMIQSCASQFSAGYLVFLVTLLAVLAFIAFRVQRSDHVITT